MIIFNILLYSIVLLFLFVVLICIAFVIIAIPYGYKAVKKMLDEWLEDL